MLELASVTRILAVARFKLSFTHVNFSSVVPE